MVVGVIIDPNLQSLPGWKNHAGGNIGGNVPKLLTMDQGFPVGEALFTVGGTSYGDVDWYISRPIQPNTGHLSLGYSLMLDGNAATFAQAIERDTIISKAGLNYNFSFQILIADKWKLQISAVDGGWVDTGYAISPLAPGVWHSFLLVYAFDFAKKTYGTQAVIINGVYYPIIAGMQGLAAKQTGWADGCIFQFQQDLNSAGGQFSERLAGANYTWW